MNASRILLACALAFAALIQARANTADTGASSSLPEESIELTVDPQGEAVDFSPTVRDPIRGERSY